MSKKIVTPEWLKVGAKVLIAKYDPSRTNIPSDVLMSAKEAVIDKVGVKYFYIGGTPFIRASLMADDKGFSKKRVFRDRDDIIEFLDTCGKVDQILEGVKTLNRTHNGVTVMTPAQINLVHAIMFPHEPALWPTDEIQNSIDTTEWYGVASAMFPGSKFDKVSGPQVDRAKQELKEVTVQFLSIVAQGILAKHIQ